MTLYRRLLATLAFVIPLLPCLPVAAENLPPIDTWRFNHPVETLHVTEAKDLVRLFETKDYALPAVRASGSVPRLFLRRLVNDLHEITRLRDREALFIKIALPLVARANAEILAQRKTLLALGAARKRGETLSPDQTAWLSRLAKRYGGHPEETDDLFRRVDAVPASLAIAQAIDESAWGTAHLALQSNGMFGQHAPSGLGRRSLHVAGANVDVAAFPSLLDGVLAYMTNINRNRAYAALRNLRAQHRQAGKKVNGLALADALIHYSQRGETYVTTLKRLIRRHALQDYDSARLLPGGAVIIHTAAPSSGG